MTRASYRFRNHAFGPDERAEAPPMTFAMQCVTCGLFSPKTEDAEDGSTWAIAHLRDNAGHLDYTAHLTRPYRFEPGEWQ
jgi:hypothetical protein